MHSWWVVDNVVWTDSWPSIAGVCCGLVCIIAGTKGLVTPPCFNQCQLVLIILLNKSTSLVVKPWIEPLVKSLDTHSLPRTFSTFSKFHLNTSESANIKVVHLFNWHNFHNWQHFKFMQNWLQCGQRQQSLLRGPEKFHILACNLCKVGCSKHTSAFVKVVESHEISNFAIYTLEHFCCKIFW
jgi:hypothetical protein